MAVSGHRKLAEAVAAELATAPHSLAVLITGSVGRGEHVPPSDVDLLVVAAKGRRLRTTRGVRHGLLVEAIVKTEQEWLEHFDRRKASWLYAFLESDVVYDTGPAARLIDAAEATIGRYKTSDELKNELAVAFWHGQAKLDRASASGDEREYGFWASIVTPSLLDGLYAIHDVPLPAGSRRLSYLHLLDLDRDEQSWVTDLLSERPRRRLQAARSLAARLRSELGDPNLEQP